MCAMIVGKRRRRPLRSTEQQRAAVGNQVYHRAQRSQGQAARGAVTAHSLRGKCLRLTSKSTKRGGALFLPKCFAIGFAIQPGTTDKSKNSQSNSITYAHATCLTIAFQSFSKRSIQTAADHTLIAS